MYSSDLFTAVGYLHMDGFKNRRRTFCAKCIFFIIIQKGSWGKPVPTRPEYKLTGIEKTDMDCKFHAIFQILRHCSNL